MRGAESAELKIHLPIGYPVTDGGIFIKQICNGLKMYGEIRIYLRSKEHDKCCRLVWYLFIKFFDIIRRFAMGFWTCSAAFQAYGNVSPKWHGTAHFPGQIFCLLSTEFFGKILVDWIFPQCSILGFLYRNLKGTSLF
jgi:hypothetical protein